MVRSVLGLKHDLGFTGSSQQGGDDVAQNLEDGFQCLVHNCCVFLNC